MAVAALILVLANATLVDRVPPTVLHVSLGRDSGDDHVGLTHTTVDVEFSESVQHASAESRFHIAPPTPGTLSWDGTRTLIFTPDEKLPTAAEFHVTVDSGFLDLAGNVAQSGVGDWAFTTVGLPAMTQTVPAPDATDVPVDSSITLTFDRLMDVGLTGAAISISPPKQLRAAWNGASVQLTPGSALQFGTRYTVSVSAQAADTDGNRLDATRQFSFTTVDAGLRLLAVMPADGSAGYPVDGPITIMFDGPVDLSTAADHVRVTPPAPGDLEVVGVPDDAPNAAPPVPNVLLFRPRAPLAAHTTYTVELAQGVGRADAPGRIATGRTWSFTTGSPTETLLNQVLFLSARTGIRNLWAMNPDGSDARQITDELAPVTEYDVTGDGRRVVVAAGGQVRTLRLGDPASVLLTPATAFDYAPRFLPDGSAVIVGRRGAIAGQDQGIWLVPVDPSSPARQLLPGGAPPTGSALAAEGSAAAGQPGDWISLTAVTPDGATALVRGTRGEIVEIDVASDTARATPLRDPQGPMAWSDALHGFVVQGTRTADGEAGAWLVQPGTSKPAVPPASPAAPVAPPAEISKGGPWLVVDIHGDMAWLTATTPARLTFRALGGTAVAVTSTLDMSDRQPSFSPGGDQLVFARGLGTAGSSTGIWVVRTDGTDLQQLSPDGILPRWLP